MKFDFSSSDGLVTVADTSLTNVTVDVDSIEALFSPQEGAPTVVIFHSHTTEGYASSLEDTYALGSDGIAKETNQSVVAAGRVLADELTRLGVNTVHITDVFDSPSRSGAFARATAAVKARLSSLPRVDLVIDLHRGVIQQTGGARIKPTFYLNGRRAAQMKIIACADGDTESQKTRLAAAFSLMHSIARISPLIAMPVSLESQIYALDLPAPAVMIEIGTDRNPVDEAKLSSALLARAIADMLKSE